jgi:hypothetical protein
MTKITFPIVSLTVTKTTSTRVHGHFTENGKTFTTSCHVNEQELEYIRVLHNAATQQPFQVALRHLGGGRVFFDYSLNTRRGLYEKCITKNVMLTTRTPLRLIVCDNGHKHNTAEVHVIRANRNHSIASGAVRCEHCIQVMSAKLNFADLWEQYCDGEAYNSVVGKNAARIAEEEAKRIAHSQRLFEQAEVLLCTAEYEADDMSDMAKTTETIRKLIVSAENSGISASCLIIKDHDNAEQWNELLKKEVENLINQKRLEAETLHVRRAVKYALEDIEAGGRFDENYQNVLSVASFGRVPYYHLYAKGNSSVEKDWNEYVTICLHAAMKNRVVNLAAHAIREVFGEE